MGHYFERYCKDYENIENYQKAKADDFIGWDCHHRKEVELSRKELISIGMYYNRPASELIFLIRNEHIILHNKGRSLSEEHKKKLSEASKGRRHTEEARKKMSEVHKGNTNTKGMRWYNNGKINKVCYECPEGFVPGRIKKL